MRVFIRHHGSSILACTESDTVEDLKGAIERQFGICVGDQCLSHAARPMHDRRTLSNYGIRHGSTIHLNGRLRGGTTGWQLIVKPRIQKDKWSNYWKESMETKTDMEPDIHLTVQPTMTVSEVQKEVEKRMGWLPTAQLKRMEGFKDPWESAVFKGRLLAPDRALQDCGIASGDMIITVRRVLVPEGWKIVKEGDESDYSSSDEEW